jgi:RTX calcium-binding nonapeptide repeat (4 copies)
MPLVRRIRGLPLLVVLATAIGAAPASAAIIEVTAGDEFGAGAACTLREAVQATNTNQPFGGCPKGSASKRDTIRVGLGANLTIPESATSNAGGDLDVKGSGGPLLLLGPNPISLETITQSLAGSRILEITGGRTSIKRLEVTSGGAVESGGAIRAINGAKLTLSSVGVTNSIASARGGGIACEGCGKLALKGSYSISNNTVSAPGGNAEGGGIWTDAPTTLSGQPIPPVPITQSSVAGNDAVPGGSNAGIGGGIYSTAKLTISETTVGGNTAIGRGFGGGIYSEGSVDLRRVTVENNSAASSGGGVGTAAESKIDIRNSAIVGNETTGSTDTGSAFGAGLGLASTGGRIVGTTIDGNTATATAASDTAAGGGIFASDTDPNPPTLKLRNTSVTNNELAVGASSQRGAGIVTQGALEAVNTTISSNVAPDTSANGGGLRLDVSGNGSPSAKLEFSTIRQNVAAGETNDGDGISASPGASVSLRASILVQTSDGCDTAGSVISKGYNVESTVDADCAIDKPTDTHDSAFLFSLSHNGALPVGHTQVFPSTGPQPLTNAFTNNASAALDHVPANKCRAAGKPLRADARGVPRPAEDGCDAGATERTSCQGIVVAGDDALIGSKRADELTGDGSDEIILSLGGNDQVNGNSGADRACLGAGNDDFAPGSGASSDTALGGPGRDFISFNNGPAGIIDLEAGTATGGLNDILSSFEDAQGSEGDDTLLGSSGPNLLIGGGNADIIRGRGGIDVINARDGEADAQITCSPGDNSKEKARIDEGLDPAPQSC